MLYQYTDINAVKSIVENNQIWMTNVKFLNDKEEFLLGLDYLSLAFNELYEFPDGVDDECKNYIRLNFMSDAHREIYGRVMNSLYIASFSSSSDVLSQWRGYGMYAVGFDTQKLVESTKLVGNGTLLPINCHYVKSDKDSKDYALSLLKEKILPCVFDHWEINKSANYLLAFNLMQLICIYALTFKHDAFSEENESRWIYLCTNDESVLKFRTRNNILIPYIPIDIHPESILSVTVGPIENQDLASESLRMFINHMVWKHRNELPNAQDMDVMVFQSDVPFRSI